MSQPYFCVRIVDGRNVVGYTTDGKDWYPIPRAAFGSPRDAIRYADMRQQQVSPLREADDDTFPVRTTSSASPSGLTTAGHTPQPDLLARLG